MRAGKFLAVVLITVLTGPISLLPGNAADSPHIQYMGRSLNKACKGAMFDTTGVIIAGTYTQMKVCKENDPYVGAILHISFLKNYVPQADIAIQEIAEFTKIPRSELYFLDLSH